MFTLIFLNMIYGITNLDIDNLLENCNTFYGTFSCDAIPLTLITKMRFSIICNLSKKSELGTHFVTIIVFKTYALYIDSLGLSCTNSDISNFLISLNRSIFFNSVQFQNVNSIFCGFYAMLYVLYFDSNKNSQIMGKIRFTHDLVKNDIICVKYLNKLFHMM